jgi:hypothetical protein
MHRHIAFCLIAAVFIGCGFKRAPLRIEVRAQDGFAGTVRLTACAKNAKSENAEIKLNTDGTAETAACPSDDNVAVVVRAGAQEHYIPPKDVRIQRTGDGFAVLIEAEVK